MVNNFNEYLLDSLVESVKNKEIELIFSNNLRDILSDIVDTYNNNISIDLLESEQSEQKSKISYIDIDDSGIDMVSFITSSKAIDLILNDKGYKSEDDINNNDYYIYSNDNSIIYKKNRTKIKIGKLIKKLYGDKYENSGKPGEDIESFVNIFKSYRDVSKFEIVSGYDINFWYNEKQYSVDEHDNSVLNNSCMRYEECEDYIDFYSGNGVKMLILKDREDNNLIRGRALLWELDKPSGRTFMDRVYTVLDSDIELFIQYAKKEGWLYKSHQNSKPYTYIVDPINNTRSELEMEVWGISEPSSYPYLDTLSYYYYIDEILSNTEKNKPYYELNNTDGGYSYEFNGGIYVDYYGDYYSEDELTWCEFGDDYRLDGDYSYSDRYGVYIADDYAEQNMIWCKYGEEYVEQGDAIEVKGGYYMVEDYTDDDITYCEYNDEYIISRYAVWSDWYNSYLDRDDSVEVYTDENQHGTDWRPDNDSSSYYEHTDGEYYDNSVEIDEDEDEDDDE